MDVKRALRALSVAILAAGGLLAVDTTHAHTPICDCFDNGDGTVTCEGGFSDGAPVGGLPIRVFDERQKLLIDGEMAADGTFTFDAPPLSVYLIVFDGGDGHTVEILSDDIW